MDAEGHSLERLIQNSGLCKAGYDTAVNDVDGRLQTARLEVVCVYAFVLLCFVTQIVVIAWLIVLRL